MCGTLETPVYIYTGIYIYIHIYTHTHTHTQKISSKKKIKNSKKRELHTCTPISTKKKTKKSEKKIIIINWIELIKKMLLLFCPLFWELNNILKKNKANSREKKGLPLEKIYFFKMIAVVFWLLMQQPEL